MLVVEVMQQLVHQRAQESPVAHHLHLLRRAHPQRDARGTARDFVRLVEAVQLARVVRGSPLEHDEIDGRRAQLRIERVRERLALRADIAGPFAFEGEGDGTRVRLEHRHVGEGDPQDPVALAVGPLRARGEGLVVGERHAE